MTERSHASEPELRTRTGIDASMPALSVRFAGAPYATAISPPMRTRTGVSIAWVAAS